MQQFTYINGHTTFILVERIYWLGLGGFLGLAILTSLIRSFNETKAKERYDSARELDKLAKKAVRQNNEDN